MYLGDCHAVWFESVDKRLLSKPFQNTQQPKYPEYPASQTMTHLRSISAQVVEEAKHPPFKCSS